MRFPRSLALVLLKVVVAASALTTASVFSFSALPRQQGELHFAAPAPPPIGSGVGPATSLPAPEAVPTATQLYSIGDPTPEEQLYLEFINRARANPAAEGLRMATTSDPDVLDAYGMFSVNLMLMQAQMALIPPRPPLSMSRTLVAVARAHSQDMLTSRFQGHNGSNGSTTASRIIGSGYTAGAGYFFGENVFSYAYSPFYGHASFVVDWGGSIATGGMQVPPGHRDNIHSANFREVGIGVVNGTNNNIGPQVVTQDFGSRSDALPLVTGVVYHDRNGNSFYDVGEGIAGVTVTIPGSEYYAVTSSSGGYSVPVPFDGQYLVNFSGTSVPPGQQTVVITNEQNAKVDYLAVPTNVGQPPSSVLANISTRLRVGATDDEALIGGFIITGTQPKKVIIRALGPSLPVPGRLQNPRLELHSPTGMIAANDNWNDAPNRQEIVDSTVAPNDNLEAAIVATLPANATAYTAIVRSVGGATGVASVEIYDLDRTVDSKLANISTRGLVQVDDSVMIGGFIISGGAKKVIVRAVAGSLPVAGRLQDPVLELHGPGGLIATNDNWNDALNRQEIIDSTVPPVHQLESAIVATLPGGNTGYTAIIRGVNRTTGVSLVEVYALD